jgi:transcriptional regulator with GAF, ATPase, and Fis domain
MHAVAIAKPTSRIAIPLPPPAWPLPADRREHDHELDRRLVGVLEAIASATRSDEMLRRLGDRLHQLLDVDFTGWALVGGDGALQPLVVHEAHDVGPLLRAGAPASEPLAWVLATQEPLQVADLDVEPRWPQAMRALRALGVGRARLLPLTTSGRRLGVLLLGRRHGVMSATMDAGVLRDALPLVAATLENVLRFERAEEARLAGERTHLGVLLDVGRALASEDALSGVLATLDGALARVLPGAVARLSLANRTGVGPHDLRPVQRLPLQHDERRLGTLDVGGVARVPASLLPLLEALAAQAAPAIARIVRSDDDGRDGSWGDIVGSSPALRRTLRQVEVVAPTDATVLLLGETGTGKELLARAIHERSDRRGRPFVKINCAAIPSGLLESELFGHEKGAFTSAIAQKIGRFEVADGGTLFLDEVGEIPLELQSKLLRVLQEQEFERLGGTRTIKVDVRIVAATNRDLAAMVEEHRFREDLYYRLNVFPLAVPPLRERPEDVEPLVRHFVARFARRMQRRIDEIPADTLEALRCHPWPGNVRELENLVQRALILAPGPRLTLPPGLLAAPRGRAAHEGGTTLANAQRAHILRVLEETNWMLGGPRGAAVRLGMKRTTLQSLMKRLGIQQHDARSI